MIGAFADAPAGTAGVGSIAIGNYAGASDSTLSNEPLFGMNVIIGYVAARNMGTGNNRYNVIIGATAGQCSNQNNTYSHNHDTFIGYGAGSERNDVNEGNLFIGVAAGKGGGTDSKGDYNISIGSFASTGGTNLQADNVNSQTTHDYNLNIANLITGNWSIDSVYRKRVKIGDVLAGTTVTPNATLELESAHAMTVGFYISRAVGQSSSLMQADTQPYNYNDWDGEISNTIVNKNGFLTLPRFKNKAALNAVSAVDNPGMLALYSTCSRDVWPGQTDNWHAVYDYHMVYSDGHSWNLMPAARGDIWTWNPSWAC
jgi:hypothetical protein